MIVEAEALRVGPDEVLLIKLTPTGNHDDDQAMINAWMDGLAGLGLEGRSMVCIGDVEMTVVPRSASAARPA